MYTKYKIDRNTRQLLLHLTRNYDAYRQRPDTEQKKQVIRCIDLARDRIGKDIEDDRLRNLVKNAIWLSCLNGTCYNYAAFDGILPYARRTFFALKNRFLNDLLKELGLQR